jgi:hypothetical protein
VTGAGFRIDPQVLASSGTSVGQCATDLAGAVQRLQATVTSSNPWGGDEPGTVFGMAYTAVLGHALEVYASHVEQLGFAAEGLSTWANTITEADSAVAESARMIAGQGA